MEAAARYLGAGLNRPTHIGIWSPLSIIYLVQQPFGARDRRRYGVDLMVSRGHPVNVIDVGPLLFPNLAADRSHYDAVSDIRLHVVTDADSLECASKMFNGARIVFCFIAAQTFSRKAVPILRKLNRSGAPYAVAMVNAVPGWRPQDRRYSLRDRMAGIWARRHEIDPLNTIIARWMPRGLLGISSAHAIVYGGRRSVGASRLTDSGTHKIFAHAMDYDIYLEERARSHPVQDVAVFLDQNLAFTFAHTVELRARRWINPAAYFAGLRALFDRVERELGLRVVIAQHPRARYEDPNSLFGGREIAVGNTAALVARSRLTITHTSTAVNFAVLYRKPVLFATTRELYAVHPFQRYWYDSFPPALGKRLQYFDRAEDVDLSDALMIDDAAYDTYIADYIKAPGTPEQPFWQIVGNDLSRAGIATI